MTGPSFTEARTTKGTASTDRSDLVFAGFRSLTWPAATSPCPIGKNPCGSFSTVKSITSTSSARNWKKIGHVFRTKSDTEVIIHGYKQWGDEVLNRLNGMFGLAIWDVRQKRLVAGARRHRDQVALLQSRRRARYISGRRCAPIRATMPGQSGNRSDVAESIFALPLYALALHDIQGRPEARARNKASRSKTAPAEVSRWYRFAPSPVCATKSAGRSQGGITFELYIKAVNRQLISDVPVGMLLSGGMDSGSLLALMNLTGKCWPTYTVGYGSSYRGRRTGGRRRDCPHTGIETHVRSDYQIDLRKGAAKDRVGCLEEPIAASSIVPMYFVCERARQDVKVAFVGQGPDELFGGYRRHLGVRYGAIWARMPRWTRRLGLLGCRPPCPGAKPSRAEFILSASCGSNATISERLCQSCRESKSITCFTKECSLVMPATPYWKVGMNMAGLMSKTDELGGLQFLEVRSTLPDELLMYADKLSMAHGLELRVPFSIKKLSNTWSDCRRTSR